MNKIRTMVIAAVMAAAIPGLAVADDSGYYIGGAAGVNIPGDSDIEGSGIDTSADLDLGPVVIGSFGYAYGNGLRAEVEVGHRWNDVDSVGGASASGDVETLTGMINAFYDIDTGTAITPYLGVGVGGARVHVDGTSPVGGSQIDDVDAGFAAQGIIGASYAMTEQLNLTLDYRYLTVPDLSYATLTNRGVDTDYSDHAVMVGLRWEFGGPAKPAPVAAAPKMVEAPPPPPPPPAAPAVPKSYLVFFDFDKSDLTPEAREILRQAADNARVANITRIEATGHADRAGTDKYNLKLSKRRAEAVQAELVRLGLSGQEIGVAWKGETDPLVPTDDGVREPQNRRVEIVFP